MLLSPHLVTQTLSHLIVCLVQILVNAFVWWIVCRRVLRRNVAYSLVLLNVKLLDWALAPKVFLTLGVRSVMVLESLLSAVGVRFDLRLLELLAGFVGLVNKFDLFYIIAAQTCELDLVGWRSCLLCNHVFLRLIEFFYTCKVAVVVL